MRSVFTFMPEPLPLHKVRLRADLGGGALVDVGCYTVNAARMVFDEVPVWASAQLDVRSEYGVEVSLAGILDFGAGRFATFDCGFRAPGQGRCTAVGSRGQIEVPSAVVPGPGRSQSPGHRPDRNEYPESISTSWKQRNSPTPCSMAAHPESRRGGAGPSSSHRGTHRSARRDGTRERVAIS